MIDFQIRYDETLAKWQYQDRKGRWSRPVRMPKLVTLLQAELTSFEEAAAKPTRTHPSTSPATYNRSPIRELAAQVEYEIAQGRVVPRKVGGSRQAQQLSELMELLDL